MKLSSILCGAAAVALLATAAQAHGPVVPPVQGGTPSATWGQHVTNPSTPSHGSYTNYAGTIQTGENVESRWAAEYTGRGNVGNAGTRDGATFTLRGQVTPHCVFYTGNNSDLTFNFGQIGIYASENHGPALAFDQVAGANLKFRTNLAGCNTKNKVTLSRSSSALKTAPSFGYDSAQFTTEIPYTVTAVFKAPNVQSNSHFATPREMQLVTGNSSSQDFGAWKSTMEITVDIAKAQKSLVAGDYTGSFSVTIQAL